MYVYCVYSAMSYSWKKKPTVKLSKKSRNRRSSKRFRRPGLYCKFLVVARHESGTRKTIYWSKCDERAKISLQVLYRKKYTEQTFKLPWLKNISNQFNPKKLLYIKSLGTDKTGVTPMRSDGLITADTKQKSSIPYSVSPYSPRNHKTTSPTAPEHTP